MAAAPRSPNAPKPRRVRGALRVFLRTPDRGEPKWWVAVPKLGRRALDLVATVSREEAYRVACERYAAGHLARGDGGEAEGAPESTLRRIGDLYDTERGPTLKPRSRRSISLHFEAFTAAMTTLGVEYPSQLSDEVISRWVNTRVKGSDGGKNTKGVEHATLNRALGAIRTALRWAATREPPLCALTPLDKRRNLSEIDRKPHPTIPSPEEWRALVGALAEEPYSGRWGEAEQVLRLHAVNSRGVALLVGVAVHSGLRLDELRHLREDDCDRDVVHVRAHDGWSPKGWQERSIPVGAGAADAAREMARWRATAKGTNGIPLAIGEHWINERIDAAWKRAKLPGSPPRMHDARRTFCTELIRAGQGLAVARDRLGHRDVATTERYVGKYRSDAEQAVPDVGVLGILSKSAGPVPEPTKPRPNRAKGRR